MNRQNDTKSGILSMIVATTTLLDKEGTLAKLSSTGVTPPTANTDLALYLVYQGAAVGSYAEVMAIYPERNVRVRLNGTCAKGDTLILDTGADLGKVCTLGAATGRLFSPGIAEEAGVDEQMVLMRPFPRYLNPESAPTAFVSAAPAATGATNTTPYGFTTAAQADAIRANVNEIRAVLVAKGLMS